MMNKTLVRLIILCAICTGFCYYTFGDTAVAQQFDGFGRRGQFLKRFLQKRGQDGSDESSGESASSGGGAKDVLKEKFNNRVMDIYFPDKLPPEGRRALVVILHGGLGNSNNARKSLQMDGVADKYGFIIAYMNGAKGSGPRDGMQTWNGGGCCGKAVSQNIDDVGYITGAIRHLTEAYGIDKAKIFGVGHSNGAIMTHRLMCQTGIYTAAAPIAGTLMVKEDSCPAAKGKRVLDIHGTEDLNVPIGGGRGTKGISNAVFQSEAETQRIYERSGASFRLIAVPNADHRPKNIRDSMEKSGTSMQEEIVKFFGLN